MTKYQWSPEEQEIVNRINKLIQDADDEFKKIKENPGPKVKTTLTEKFLYFSMSVSALAYFVFDASIENAAIIYNSLFCLLFIGTGISKWLYKQVESDS